MDELVLTGPFSPHTNGAIADHIVGLNILLPGVGYVEMAFSSSGNLIITGVAFVRPCSLPELGAEQTDMLLRYMRQDTGAFEIASQK